MQKGPPTDMFAFDFLSLCKDARFAAAIANVQQYTRHVIVQDKRLQTRFQALIKIIDTVLGKTPKLRRRR